MSAPNRLALVGVGKIARDAHVPAIAASSRFALAAAVDPTMPDLGGPSFGSLDDLLRQGPAIDAVAICTPPQYRRDLALAAIDAGKSVLLEKPPALTAMDAETIVAAARDRGVTAFAAWHSREAAAVAPARGWLADRTIRRVAIDWREDVRKWHPGQEWIFDASGFGVFDPAINALSILTAIVPGPIAVADATLEIPGNRESPIRARASMSLDSGAPVTLNSDFLETRGETWSIEFDTDSGRLRLEDGGARATVDGVALEIADRTPEYSRLYERFAELIASRNSDVDVSPLALVEQAMAVGTRRTVEPFHFDERPSP